MTYYDLLGPVLISHPICVPKPDLDAPSPFLRFFWLTHFDVLATFLTPRIPLPPFRSDIYESPYFALFCADFD
jgi:hypothetical protein